MKFIKYFLFLLILLPFNTYAYIGALQVTEFDINNQTSEPFNITINSNSNKTVDFNLYWEYSHGSGESLDLPGSYLFMSIISDKKLSIKRTNNVGVYCGTSCFSNDIYLQTTKEEEGDYEYIFYFNIVKWKRTIGTQVDTFYVGDRYTFTNLQSGTAHVYMYGVFANEVNEIPNLISQANTTQQIIIDGQTNTDYIIDNQNDNTNQLIQSNDENTIKLIESQSICTFVDKNYKGIDGVALAANGNITTSGASNYMTTDYITINSHYNIIIKQPATQDYVRFCLYDKNKTYIACDTSYGSNINDSITIPNEAQYIRFTIYKNTNRPQYNLCINGNQGLNQNIDNINDNITNNDIDNPSGDFGDMEDLIASNGVITNLIALPITLYSNILNGLNQNCSEYNFGQLFGSDIKFQCINLGTLLGTTIWGIIDVLFSGFTIYAIARKMIKVFNNFSGLQEGDVIDD